MPVRVGIVGLGYWGPNLLRNFAADSDCMVVWGCDLNTTRLHKLERQYPAVRFTTDAPNLLDDKTLDLIVIATPNETHADLASRALKAGKHVFIEKPMTRTTKEADALLHLGKRVRRKIFVDHTFVFAPAVQEMAVLANRGMLGKLLYFDSTRINLGLIQKDVNVLWDLAIHDLAILSTFMNLRDIRTISAHGHAYFGNQEEVAHLHLDFRSGFHAHVHVSWLSPVKLRTTILAGTRSMVTFHDTEPSEKLRVYDKGVDRGKPDSSAVASAKADPFFPLYRSGNILIPAIPNTETLALEVRHVLRCLQGKEEPWVTGDDGRTVVAILEAADKSMKTGKAIRIGK